MRIYEAFRDLKVRHKLMIAHNLFFLVFAGSAWFTLIPRIERGVEEARDREVRLIRRMFSLPGARELVADIEAYEFREGSAAELGVPSGVQARLDAEPGAVVESPLSSGVLYGRDAASGQDQRLGLPSQFYDSLVASSRAALATALAIVYCLAVLTLELWLMRIYIYRPVHALLRADEASRRGDTGQELIDASLIGRDELGQIMSSRNTTVRELRQQERDLQRALHQLEETADDLRKKNKLLETAKQNIADQDRLASVGLLSASVAHELNTPLAVLRGSIEKLLENVEEPPSRENLERMLRVSQRLQTMSESLVEFARVRHHEMTPVSIRQIIDESWRLVAIDERATAVHLVNGTGEGDIVIGNADRLVQLFVNLLRNALLAVRPDGNVQVESRRALIEDRDCVFVSVIDDGPGIPPDVLPDVFEAFVTTRLDARGTGLGLTVAEGIAHQHGGAITAANRPEGGACLEVSLPAAPASPTS